METRGVCISNPFIRYNRRLSMLDNIEASSNTIEYVWYYIHWCTLICIMTCRERACWACCVSLLNVMCCWKHEYCDSLAALDFDISKFHRRATLAMWWRIFARKNLCISLWSLCRTDQYIFLCSMFWTRRATLWAMVKLMCVTKE